jgi:hypothetical protein
MLPDRSMLFLFALNNRTAYGSDAGMRVDGLTGSADGSTLRMMAYTTAESTLNPLRPLLLWGCSAPASRTQEVTADEPQTSTAADPAPAEAETAEKLFEDIAQKVSMAKLVKVYTEEDDPNEMLGRPNGYTSKIAFSDWRISKDAVEGTDADAIERGGFDRGVPARGGRSGSR